MPRADKRRSLPLQVALLIVIAVLVTALLFYTLAKSKSLADFLDSVSDERLPLRAKWSALLHVWRQPRDRGAGPDAKG